MSCDDDNKGRETWVSNASCSTPKYRAAARVSRARSTAEVQCVCQHALSLQLGLGSCFWGTIETWPLYKNCNSSKNTSYPTELTGITPGVDPAAGGAARFILEQTGSNPDGGSGPQKNFLKKRLLAAKIHLWAWTKRPSTLKVTSEKAWPLMRRLR